MIIKRNKYVTKINDEGTIYRISTEKFDDIIGTSDNSLPDDLGDKAKDEAGQLIKYSGEAALNNFRVRINGRRSTFKDMLEFSDMSPKLFSKSLITASKAVVSESYLTLTAIRYIDYLTTLIRYASAAVAPAFESAHRGTMGELIREKEALPILGYPSGSNNVVAINIVDFIDNNKRKEEVILWIKSKFDHYVPQFIFSDKGGNDYRVLLPTVFDIDKALTKWVLSKSMKSWTANKTQGLDIMDLNLLPCILVDPLSAKFVDKNGRVVVKTFPEVLPKPLMEGLKTFGINGLAPHLDDIVKQLMSITKIGSESQKK